LSLIDLLPPSLLGRMRCILRFISRGLSSLDAMKHSQIAIVGSGFSGITTAYHLLAHGPENISVTIFCAESKNFGPAYSTTSHKHLLNVRARNMGAFPGSPGDFQRWLESQGRSVVPDDFLPRVLFRQYLEHIREELSSRFGERFRVIEGEVFDIAESSLQLKDSLAGPFDRIILALGEGVPKFLNTSKSASTRVIQNPWKSEFLEQVSGRVIIAGTGLTAVDLFLTLRDQVESITMVSKHGLLPAAHETVRSLLNTELLEPWKAPTRKEMTARMRAALKAGFSWQSVFEWIRPHIQTMWLALTEKEQARLLRHFAPYWNILRHRMAESSGREITGALESGLLRIEKGRVSDAFIEKERLEVLLANGKRLQADWLINCAGPDATYSSSALLSLLRTKGLLQVGPHSLGIRTNLSGQTINSAGEINEHLFLVGGLRKGLLWETTAVPDLRKESLKVALAVIKSL